MDLVLVTKTPIIEKIFSLVCRKLNINILIKDNIDIKDEVDFIIIDEEFINDDFNSLKQKTKKIAAICAEELPFDKSRDFIINRPFLPTVLEELIKEQIEDIKNEARKYMETSNEIDDYNIQSEEEVITNYVESLADDVALDIDEENDESIVNIASMNTGGILDNSELGKISNILSDDTQNQVFVDENDWKDINEIIDDALDEVNEFEVSLEEEKEEPVKVVLNDYNINELKPFLQKFDQDVIDRLSNGENVDVTLSLKVNK